MRIRLFSLLRYVCNLYEAQRPISGPLAPETPTARRVNPAFDVLRRRAQLLLLAVVAALISVNPVSAGSNGWGTSGSFKLAGVSSKTKVMNWKDNQIKTSWNKAVKFELSKSGKKRPVAYSFRMPKGSALAKLGALIQHAESPRGGYDAVHGSAKRRPPKRPTQLTLGQLYQWIRATPGQHHALGKYQIIPATLRRLQVKMGVSSKALFSPALQDRMAYVLYLEAGYRQFAAGKLPMSKFMDNLAKIWAGLPKANGKSHYHGYAGNRATITRTFYSKHMQRIFKL